MEDVKFKRHVRFKAIQFKYDSLDSIKSSLGHSLFSWGKWDKVGWANIENVFVVESEWIIRIEDQIFIYTDSEFNKNFEICNV